MMGKKLNPEYRKRQAVRRSKNRQVSPETHERITVSSNTPEGIWEDRWLGWARWFDQARRVFGIDTARMLDQMLHWQ